MPTTSTNVLQKLQQHCLLITLHVCRWGGSSAIDGATTVVDELELDLNDSTLPRWKLLPRIWQTKFQGLEGKARALIKEYSVPFNLRGVYVVPLTVADSLFSKLEEVRDNYDDTTAQFVASYDDWVGNLKDKLGTAFNSAKKNIPSKTELKTKFSIEWAILPIGYSENDFSNSALITRAKETMQKLVLESIHTMIRAPRLELAHTINNIVSGEDSKNIRSPTLEKLLKSFEKYLSFAFIVDPTGESIAHIKQIKDLIYGLSAREINRDEDLRIQLMELLKELHVELVDESKIAETFDNFQSAR